MAEMTISIEFDGYQSRSRVDRIPSVSGVYAVHRGVYRPEANTVQLTGLLYIGESGDIRERITHHDRWDDWEENLLAGESLWFSYGAIDNSRRNRAEAALIFHHKPPLNTSGANQFNYDRTTIVLSGRHNLLAPYFTVDRTPKQPVWSL